MPYKESEKMIIGVIGHGTVGKAVAHTLAFYHTVRILDKYVYCFSSNDHFKEILTTDVIFVCVPTPLKEDRLDMSAVKEVLELLARNCYHGVVIIKSTLKIGAMDEFKNCYNLRLVYAPEFLRGRSSLQFFVVPPGRLVFSGEPDDVKVVLEIFEWCETRKIIMDNRSAEVMKLAHNAMFATKVSFTNEIKKVCLEVGANPQKVMNAIAADPRNGPSHLDPTIGPYAESCLGNDALELMQTTPNNFLLEAVHRRNEETKINAKKLGGKAK